MVCAPQFEIHKTIWRLRVTKSRMVALQFPEGSYWHSRYVLVDSLLVIHHCSALLHRLIIIRMHHIRYIGAICRRVNINHGWCDIWCMLCWWLYRTCIRMRFHGALWSLMSWYLLPSIGTTTCVDLSLYAAVIVPIDVSQINMLYVFVDITIDLDHFVQSVIANFKATDRLVLAGTIQFATAMQSAYKALKAHFPVLLMPQAKPLSRGEVLGCTSPKFEPHDALM